MPLLLTLYRIVLTESPGLEHFYSEGVRFNLFGLYGSPKDDCPRARGA